MAIVNNILIDGTKAVGDITIPENVTAIAPDAFAQYESIERNLLTSVSMANVVTIGYGAFAFNLKLRKVDMPKVTVIGARAFSTCIGLTNMNMPSVTDVEWAVFEWTPSLDFEYTILPSAVNKTEFQKLKYSPQWSLREKDTYLIAERE
ncbi:leucine-rich repeat domain-containing protein [Ureaplasma miroungigenitalium]|uniref:Leucine-rich repeat domain-containing protein n=1 Tax=Ureaplasma miroungigenitalium TaxID=1042321 RepID=A0ABT3BM58_9BACT|nr:leucine-rich repeat domain-containing protein [Ureaplasma miroungigenitalium]